MSGKFLAGRYELLERKGNGGMAVVYKGKDCLLDRYVAIKILRPEYISDPKFIENFRKESQAAAKLSDPNIVSVYDVGREGNIYYIVMELMDGSSLGDLIEQEAPLSEEETIQIALQIASGLSSAHKKKIIHRDIKPHNILMSENGDAKIADFGIAKAASGATVVSGSSTVMGSVHYLSPEQAKGAFVDARTDLYSLGIVMYEMLTGTVPFDGENPVSVAMMHINNDIPAPSLRNPSVSPIMDEIVQTAAARNPADRYGSVDELIQALEQAWGSTGEFAAERTERIEDQYDQYDDGYGSEDEDEFLDDLEQFEDYEDDGIGRKFKKRRAAKKEKKEKGKRSGKLGKVIAIVLALICAVPLSMFVLHAIGGMGDNTVAIPNVVGMTKDEAVQALDDKGLDYDFGTTVYSDKYKEGEVASVEPTAGTHVKKGYTVTLRLARESSFNGDSSKMVKIPKVTGMSLTKAKAKLKEEGLRIGDIEYEYSDSKDEDTVLSQDPGEGEKVRSGTRIDLKVSKGKDDKEVKVPSLKGMTRSEASETLEELGLELGQVTQEYSDEKVGTVIRQGVSAGTTVQKEQKISITLSMGKKPDSSDDDKKKETDTDDKKKQDTEKETDQNSDNNHNNSGNNSSGNNGNSSGNGGSSSNNGNDSTGGNTSGGNSGGSTSGGGNNSGGGSTGGGSTSGGGSTGGGSTSGGGSTGGGSTSGGNSSTHQDGVVDDE